MRSRLSTIALRSAMTKAAEAVLADALRLDLRSRADLAAELLASLDGPDDPEAERTWMAEIDRRVETIESGAEPLESWDETMRRAKRDIGGR